MTSLDVSGADRALLTELEPVAAAAVEEHLRHAADWHPHQYIPWDRARTFEGPLGGRAWHPDEATLDPACREGLVHNLLSEGNLPNDHRVIAGLLGLDGAWGLWVNQWTMEESRHGVALRDYLLVTRSVDPVGLERACAARIRDGLSDDRPGDVLASLARMTFRELATRITYRNIRRRCGDPAGEALLRCIARDENRHMVFYRTILEASLRLQPDRTVTALAEAMETMRAPGHDAPGYQRLVHTLARAGIYDPVVHHEEVLMPVVRRLDVLRLEGLGAEGEKARDRLTAHLDLTAGRARHFLDLRERARRSR